MSDDTYNGWSNYETWNVALWLGNDEGLYRESERIRGRAYSPESFGEALETFVRDTAPNGFETEAYSLDDVDFEEIATALWDEDE